MYVLRLKGRTNLLKVMLVVVAAMLAAFLLVLVGTAKPAGATFPGQNGKIAYVGCDFPVCDIYTINPDGTGKINPPEVAGLLPGRLMAPRSPTWVIPARMPRST